MIMDCVLDDPSLPNLDPDLFDVPDLARVDGGERPVHAPRILLLYGSLRERSFSRFLTFEVGPHPRGLMGAEVRIFDPSGLPMTDSESKEHASEGG